MDYDITVVPNNKAPIQLLSLLQIYLFRNHSTANIRSIAVVATPFWFLYFHFIAYVCLLFYIHRHCHCLHTHTRSSHHTSINVRLLSCKIHPSVSNTVIVLSTIYVIPGESLFNQIVVRSLEVFGFESEKVRANILLLERLFQQKGLPLVGHFMYNR